jgi:hypothetical protein
MHSNLMSHFSGFNASPRYADCFLAEFRHRFNNSLGRLNVPGTIDFGHHDPWLINTLQELSTDVFDDPALHLFPTWVNSDRFEATGETFGILQLSEDVRARNGNPLCNRYSKQISNIIL